MMHTVIIGSPSDIRVKLFQEALLEQQQPLADVISYQYIIEGQRHLAEVVRADSVVRIESPGKDTGANQALLILGIDALEDEDSQLKPVSADAIAEQINDKGRIIAPHQWYLGLETFLKIVEEQLAECPPHHLMNHPDEILMMFDKRLCHQYLERNGVSVPKALPPIKRYEDLREQMREHDMQRVFLKLAHGSSASGVLAIHNDASKGIIATSAVEIMRGTYPIKLYNSRRIWRHHDHIDLQVMIDLLCRQGVHVEQWIPKASMDGKSFDLRVVVVEGKAAHCIARLSHSPMTNLHLLNERRDRETVKHHLGDETFQAVMTLCEDAMQCFPKSLYTGVDVLVASGMKNHYILEMNAFGDLLKETYYQGLSPYAYEIQRMVARHEHA